MPGDQRGGRAPAPARAPARRRRTGRQRRPRAAIASGASSARWPRRSIRRPMYAARGARRRSAERAGGGARGAERRSRLVAHEQDDRERVDARAAAARQHGQREHRPHVRRCASSAAAYRRAAQSGRRRRAAVHAELVGALAQRGDHERDVLVEVHAELLRARADVVAVDGGGERRLLELLLDRLRRQPVDALGAARTRRRGGSRSARRRRRASSPSATRAGRP